MRCILWFTYGCCCCWFVALTQSQLLESHIDQFFHDVSITDDSDSWIIEADGIPNDDPAWSIERNPNAASAQNHYYRFYKTPDFRGQASCTPLGPIGFALNGVPFFNAQTAEGCDAVVYESPSSVMLTS